MGGWVDGIGLMENIANSARPAGAGAGAWAELGKKRKKLTYGNNGHLSFPVTRFRNQRSFMESGDIRCAR